jgi:hypothetical protein
MTELIRKSMTTLPTGSTAVSRPINNRHECQEIQEQAHIGRSALGTPDGGLGSFVLAELTHGSVPKTGSHNTVWKGAAA